MTRISSQFQQMLHEPSLASMLRGSAAQSYAPTDQEMAKLESKGFIGNTLGGLQAIGNVFDVPGSYVRGKLYGAATGDWSRGPQSAFDSEGRVYGSDFLDAAGWKAPETWAGQENESFNPFSSEPSAWADPDTYLNSANKLAHGILGFAGDVVTDPLSLISPFGKTAQGMAKTARAAEELGLARKAMLAGDLVPAAEGFLAKKFSPAFSTVTNDLRQGDRALLTVHKPWWMESLGLTKRGGDPLLELGHASEVPGMEHVVTSPTGTSVIKGREGQALADQLNKALANPDAVLESSTPYNAVNPSFLANKAADIIDKMSYGALSPIRIARGMLDNRVNNQFGGEAQRAADAHWVNFKNEVGNAQEAGRLFQGAHKQIIDEIGSIVKHSTENGDPKFADELVRTIQTHPAWQDVNSILDEVLKLAEDPAALGVVDPVRLRGLSDRMADFAVNFRQIDDASQGMLSRYGGPQPKLDDAFSPHVGRYPSKAVRSSTYENDANYGWSKKEHQVDGAIARKEAGRNIAGNEATMNAIAKDTDGGLFINAPKDPVALREFLDSVSQGNYRAFLPTTTTDPMKLAMRAIHAPSDRPLYTKLLTAVSKGDMTTAAKIAKQIPEEAEITLRINKNVAKGYLGTLNGMSSEDIANSTLGQVRSEYLFDKHMLPAGENEFGGVAITKAGKAQPRFTAQDIALEQAKIDANLNLVGNKFPYKEGNFIPAPRDPTGAIIKDPITGKYPDYVRVTNEGTPTERAMDYYDWFNEWNPRTEAAKKLGEEHPMQKLIRYTDSFGPEKLKNGIYDNNVAEDLTKYLASNANKTATLRTMHDWIGREGMTGTDIKNGIPLDRVWTQSSLDPKGLGAFLENNKTYKANYEQALDMAAQKATNRAVGLNPALDQAKTLEQFREKLAPKIAAGQASSILVHPNAVKGIQFFTDLADTAKRPGEKPGEILSFIDRFNTVWKTLQYNIWPPSHIRDIGSRVVNSALDGRASLGDILSGTYEGVKYLINPKLASEETLAAIDRFNKLGVFKNYMAQDIGGGLESGLARGYNKNPSSSVFNIGAVPGARGRSREALEAGASVHPWINAGYKVQQWGDYSGQFGHFRALEKTGKFSPEQIAQIIRETHYTSELSQFEKTFLSRVVPFERFTVRNIPHQIAAVFSEPGGRTAQAVRAMTENSAVNDKDKDVYVPEWMRERTVYDAGKNEKGEQGYFSNTIMPQSELNDIIFGHGLMGNLWRTGEKFLGKASPPATAFMERPWSDAGSQLDTGRKIGDLESPLSNIASDYAGKPVDMKWLDQLIHYASPAPRLHTQAMIPLLEHVAPYLPGAAERTADNPVKFHSTPQQILMGMLGLGKTSYYNSDKWKNIDVRAAHNKEAEQLGAKPWTSFSLPKQGEARMTPEQIAQAHAILRRSQGLTERLMQGAAQERSKKQAAAAAAINQPTL